MTLSQGRHGTGLVDIVSGSFGAGHDAAAREIAIRFEARGYTTRTWDVVDLFPVGIGRVLRAVYLQQLRHAPGTWGSLLRGLEPSSRRTRTASRALAITAPGLLRIAADGPDVVVSTHPFASQSLGRLRDTGRIDVRVVTYLTDMSVHPLWVHPSVDLHLALHEVPAAQARTLGGRAVVVDPLAGGTASPHSVGSLAALRRRLGLPVGRRLALVTGGAEGIGALDRAAADVAGTGLAHPVVLCARNGALRDHLKGRADVTALGWRDDLPDVLAAVDVVVQNAGGFTSQQALAAGVPQVSYRCIPGHGETNAEALEQAGLVPWARTLDTLPSALHAALSRPPGHLGAAVPGRRDLVDVLFPERARVPA
jgi:UDP-N-acetylglucosamine:LPS N-acetylglucosamine transferase